MSARENKFMTISLEKGIELYLATEGKSPRYIGWSLTSRTGKWHDHGDW